MNNSDLRSSNRIRGLRILSFALNLPGPLACHELQRLGAAVVKVEPPQGDLLEKLSSDWYWLLRTGQRVMTQDLKTKAGLEAVGEELAAADVVITSMRPSTLARLRLTASDIHCVNLKANVVHILGAKSDPDLPHHDLTLQANAGLLQPPAMPISLFVDLAAGLRIFAEILALAAAGSRGRVRKIYLQDCAYYLAQAKRFGLTGAVRAPLSGADPMYSLHQCADGFVALAGLEPKLREQTAQFLLFEAGELCERSVRSVVASGRSAGIPIAAVR